MEIRRKLILVSVLSFMCGTLVTQLPIFIDAVDCNNVPTYHVYYLGQIKDCLDRADRQQVERLDATNNVFFSEIERLEEKVDNATRR